MRKLLSIFSLLLFFTVNSLFAQEAKFGHLNSGNLLSMMPEAKAADGQLAQLQSQLVAKGDTMVAAFRADYEKYMKESSEGLLTQIQAKQRESVLAQKQQELQQYEQTIKLEVVKKRETLLQPILKKVDEAIQAVGKEGGYLMIFDESTGAMMYSLPSQDVTDLVKKKLGI